MKLLQARLPEAEYELLRRKARAEGKTIQEWVRVALRERLLHDRVAPGDPAFLAFPLVERRRGAATNHAQHHDDLLYGGAT
ncbi:MAG: ribbon-helix-helix protein, CopG family [Euryarchaeota archaeon]|nr:ribbon-helix-helix protein, CopG family [Euryarchaeota archaeon]MDE1837936.1 ribbon-helix-helix protein, CopG family [Euryarchaeota archaeon]MDE1880180.1 ribbon-helix-helix protein, CopG family [Euryarchaeota archaeon]MDE2045397.1 ribbon-helix-helix protein, CopG family [Thermoplasmata archaeon]